MAVEDGLGLAAGEHVDDALRRADRHAPRAVFGDAGDMRREHDIGEAEQRVIARRRLFLEDVEPGAAEPARRERRCP